MNDAFVKFIVGNKNKTKFLGWNDIISKYVVLDNLYDEKLELMVESYVDNLLQTNKYTNFFIVNDMKYKYKVILTLE